jgi:hypothetical protein
MCDKPNVQDAEIRNCATIKDLPVHLSFYREETSSCKRAGGLRRFRFSPFSKPTTHTGCPMAILD